MRAKTRQHQKEAIAEYNKQNKKAERKWDKNRTIKVWQSAMDKPEYRTDSEIYTDFLKGGIQ
tara:strand:- start:570 stop:755 length:186 start_codon:yes stop_codon:yes gene_type:complete